MKTYQDEHFIGERALFKKRDVEVVSCLFDDGESPLKEGKNIIVKDSTFGWKYPLWYGNDIKVDNCRFLTTERAGIWYTNNAVFTSCLIDGPKNFRRCKSLVLEDIDFSNALETLWWNEDVKLKNVTAKGDYFGKSCKNVTVENLKLDGNYAFDSCENLHIKNSVLHTKDAFWNCKNVIIEDSEIDGEYFSWNSENITLINCKVSSNQGFCYMKNVKLVNCDLTGTDLSFEYCEDIDADVHGDLISIKNPISGIIKAEKVGEYILDDDEVDHSKTLLEKKK